MSQYRPRLLDRLLACDLETFGAVIIEGPRAVGKTTTAGMHAQSSIRLDASPSYIDLAELAPQQILEGDTPRLIDEWQLAPNIWNAVRHEVDRRNASGQFILTGSAVPADDATRHSGAGRFKRLTLRPMTLAESGDSTATVSMATVFEGGEQAGIDGPSVEDYARLIVRGGWPALVEDEQREPTNYLSAYLSDISRVDLPAADLEVDPMRMRALISALARNIATEISATKLAQEAEISGVDVSAQSVRRYLDALTRIHVLDEQPAWMTHLRSGVRQRVSTKWHFIDPSLAAAALRITPERLLGDLNTFGFFFESLVVRDLRVYAEQIDGEVTHYRDSQGLEADAIIELGDGRWAACEVKLGGKAAIESAAQGLHKLVEKVSPEKSKLLAGLMIITAGNVSFRRPDGVNVVALGHLTA